MICSAQGAHAPYAFRAADAFERIRSIEPAAIGAAGNWQEPIRIASCDKARFETPWQDRQTLFASRTRGDTWQSLAVLLMAFGASLKTMRERHNV